MATRGGATIPHLKPKNTKKKNPNVRINIMDEG
jgi:hypothetical protein